MLPDRVSNLGPLTYESGVLPIALRGPAETEEPQQKYRLGTVNNRLLGERGLKLVLLDPNS